MLIIKLGCTWCGPSGYVRNDGRCGKCGKTQNIALEKMIEKKKAEAKSYYSRFSTEYAKESRLRRKYG